MRLLLLLLTAFSFLQAHAQTEEVMLNPVEQPLSADSARHFHKILIVGEGNLPARAFIDAIGQELVKAFKEMEIECKYEYLGDKTKTDVKSALQKAKTWEHDAIFQLSPLAIVVTKETRIGSASAAEVLLMAPLVPARRVKASYYRNDLDLSLLENTTTLWFSRLTVESKFGKTAVFKKIRKAIVIDLKRQNVLAN
ncbi:hypothetical protein SAMN05428949_3500 [Chitinophaga sp. YR627]|uniref:hypothetical protein n=1 Tax=Chitinophaga sp. YR627 TaxID=1881041 RepID=UPI0008E94E07|nr:hypothetical protein [Chitinophaga sp. YR627]SFN79708.1 hypothetical protein SAMN05428949_3500 [Chitinophaga sp. YR627]